VIHEMLPFPSIPHLAKSKQLALGSSNSVARHLAEVFLEQVPRTELHVSQSVSSEQL